MRLQQIATVLNLDSVGPFYVYILRLFADPRVKEEDVDEFYNGSGISWQLTQQEARNVAHLRV